MAITMKRRDRRFAQRGLVPGAAGSSRTTDLSGRRSVLDDASLTRTRFASQEEQETCFHLIEEG
ncbi:hypothetical protein AYO43_04020 [Nitrospira sp. SCGC AG-212-E16]|nr:hypothetical protein AYO43_04020 [Nitrospira sp. SCGC AG-212-E16]